LRFDVPVGTVAFSKTEVPAVIVGCGAVAIVTTVGAVVMIIAVAVANCVGSVTELAVIVTAPPGGT
jgi:hypothetical protein